MLGFAFGFWQKGWSVFTPICGEYREHYIHYRHWGHRNIYGVVGRLGIGNRGTWVYSASHLCLILLFWLCVFVGIVHHWDCTFDKMKEVSLLDVVNYPKSDKWYDQDVAGNVIHIGYMGMLFNEQVTKVESMLPLCMYVIL